MNRTQRKEEIKSILWQAMAPNQEPMPTAADMLPGVVICVRHERDVLTGKTTGRKRLQLKPRPGHLFHGALYSGTPWCGFQATTTPWRQA